MEPETIRSLAIGAGFRADSLEKVVHLGRIAAQVEQHPLLGSALALKGGTALNLFSGQPGRLSVDLDFNYIGAEDREAMLVARPLVERAVEEIGRSQGYFLQRSPDDHAGRKIYFTFTNVERSQDRIEIDLNFVHRVGFGEVRRDVLWQPGDLPRPTMLLAGMEDICAGKLCALLDRTRPRDLYDTSRLPDLAAGIWTSRRFKRIFIAFSGMLDHPVHRYGRERLERVDQAMVDAELTPMLAVGDAVRAVDLVERTWEAIRHLVALDEEEHEFVDRLQVGELRPDLIFPEDTLLAGRVSRFPPLLWKVQNARKHGASRAGRRRKGAD